MTAHEETMNPLETSADAPPRRAARRPLLIGIALLGVGGAGWKLFGAGSGAPEAAPSKSPGNDAPVLDGRFIRFSDAFAKRAGIASEQVRAERLSPLITVNGTVTYDPRRFAAVGARIEGRVRRVAKFLGDPVKAGDQLGDIESAELGRAESQVLGARAKEKVAETDMRRERRLADARITAERDAELAVATFEAARAERIAAERAVGALGGNMNQALGILTLRSPIAGRVVAAKALRGQTLQPSDTLFEIADLSSLWVELQVFERDIASVRVGDKIEIALQPGGSLPIVGRVTHVGSVIDVSTRTAPVRVEVANEQGLLRPGQSVTARLHTAAPATEGLTVPARAITRIDGKPTVFVLQDKNTVEPRVVGTGAEDGSRVTILEGLRAGDAIVIDGMFALKSEIFR